jgi:hypothetical protein
MNLRPPRTVMRPRSVGVPAGTRSISASARETLALVLDENASLLDGNRDIDDLALRLRGHLMELGYAAPGRWPAIEKALAAARWLADTDVPTEYVAARVHLRRLAEAVKIVISELAAAGLVCGHRPECPPANADDREAARVRARRPEIGCSELCNGVLVFEDTGCLLPSGEVIGPRRPLPPVRTTRTAVTS